MSNQVKIIAIHDDLDYDQTNIVKSHPLMATLAIEYGLNNVVLFKHCFSTLRTKNGYSFRQKLLRWQREVWY